MEKKKSDRRANYTRMVLRESFIELLREKHISKITIKEICEKADVNRGTFYFHYRDQYDLLEQMEQELICDINKYLDELRFDKDESEALQMMTKIFEYIIKNDKLCTVILSDNCDIDFKKEIMMLVQKQYLTEWTNNNKIDDEIIEYIYSFATNGSIGVIQNWLQSGMKKSAHDMAEIMLKMTKQGISAFL
jgi:AcrR family transcriptional regulator